MLLENFSGWAVVIHASSFSIQHSGGRGRWIPEFEASQVYRVSSRTARATQRNPASKTKQKKQNPSLIIKLRAVGCSRPDRAMLPNVYKALGLILSSIKTMT